MAEIGHQQAKSETSLPDPRHPLCMYASMCCMHDIWHMHLLQGLVALSRLGVYIRVPGVDVAKFEQSIQGGGLLGYIDALSGGSISKVGVFSLGQPRTEF